MKLLQTKPPDPHGFALVQPRWEATSLVNASREILAYKCGTGKTGAYWCDTATNGIR